MDEKEIIVGWITVLVFGPGCWQKEVDDNIDMTVGVCLMESMDNCPGQSDARTKAFGGEQLVF